MRKPPAVLPFTPSGWARQGKLPMGSMITGDELRQLVQSGALMTDGDPAAVESVKYDFTLSSRVLKAKYKRPIDADELPKSEALEVEPGEVVFVLTKERLNLPADVVAQLSPKRKLSHAGVLTLGGLCIDPGYQGRIIVGLFNLSSTPFPLQPGKKLIAATFYRLSEAESRGLEAPREAMDDFPDDLVGVMQRYQPVAVQAVADRLTQVQGEVEGIRTEIRSHDAWYARFKDGLDRLSADLDKEVEARRSGQSELQKGQGDLQKSVGDIKENITFLRGAAWFGIALLGVTFAVFLVWLGWYFGFRTKEEPANEPAAITAPAPAAAPAPVASASPPPPTPAAPPGPQ